MLTRTFAEQFVAQWIGAWNSHDLDRILAHYTEDFEMSSPVIVQLMGEPTGTLKGKEKIRGYWTKALERNPQLHFEPIATLIGVNSLTIYYNGVRGLSAEVFHFNAEGRVERAYAHYVQGVVG